MSLRPPQDGCYKAFRWTEAKEYRRGDDAPCVPKSLQEVDPRLAKDIKHHILRDSEIALNRLPSTDFRISCMPFRPEVVLRAPAY